MSDIVLRLPIQEGEEANLFGRFLSTFMESRTPEADAMAASSDAPYMMIRSEPAEDCKVLIFQERSAAAAFSTGWANARNRRPSRA